MPSEEQQEDRDSNYTMQIQISGDDFSEARSHIEDGIEAAHEATGQQITWERVGTDSDDLIYRCTECGAVRQHYGTIHAHCERHRGFFGLQLPWRYGDHDALNQMVEVLRVESASYSEAGV